MRKTETKLVEEEIITSVICDSCEKDIYNSDDEFYYSVITSDREWGADSSDSVVQLDFCSLKCTEKAMDDYFSKADILYRFDVTKEENNFKEFPQKKYNLASYNTIK